MENIFAEKVITSGALECYCEENRKKYPDTWMVMEYEITRSNQQVETVRMCAEFRNVAYSVFFYMQIISIIIIVLNFVLRVICRKLINWVGYKTQTKRQAKMSKLEFTATFINTAFIPLLINANMQEQPIPNNLEGPFPDFNSELFRYFGALLITTMLINMVNPVVEFCISYVIRLIARMWDSSCTLNRYRTKCTSVHQYIETRGGPVYEIQFKYASVLNIVFVTFTYGFGLPILFPIAAMSFLVIYVIECLRLYYSYRVPASFDKKISEEVLSMLKFAPFFYIAFGYWMVSSK